MLYDCLIRILILKYLIDMNNLMLLIYIVGKFIENAIIARRSSSLNFDNLGIYNKVELFHMVHMMIGLCMQYDLLLFFL